MKFSKVVSVLVAAAFLSGTSFAGEVDKLANMLAEKGLISYGEAQQVVTETKESTRQLTASGLNPTLPAWIQNMSIKGDIRVRHQVDWDGANTRNRERLRLRFGIETRPVESIKAAFGIASGALGGSGDKNPTSTNHTFQSFNKVPLFIDYAYLQYDPVSCLKISGGKVKGGTHLWNPTDLIWDTDINPDGFAVNFNKSAGSKINIFANAGWYILNEGRNGRIMPDTYIIQPGISFATGNFSAKFGLSYQQFNMKDREVVSNESGSYLLPNDSDFRCINPGIELKLKEVIAGLTLGIFGDYVKNTDDTVHKNNLEGRVFGFQFGSDKIAEFGTWQIKAMNRYLEEYAVPLGLGDSDAYGGKGNSKGYEVILTLGIAKNLSFGFDYYQMEQIDGSKNPKSLAQFDLNYKF
ncbi:MAG: putative porin [Endomicrobium sp.]|nr:putative porin [Endomicrobium sp.]